MPRTDRILSWVLMAVFALPGVQTASAEDDRWTASAATTAIEFHREILSSLGIRRSLEESTADPAPFPGSGYRSLPERSLLEFRAPGGDFESFDSGSLFHDGGFVLEGNGIDAPLSLLDFELRVSEGDAVFDLLDQNGQRWFTVHNMQFIIAPREEKLFVLHAGLYLSPELLQRLGFPDSATVFVGELNIAFPAIVPPELRSSDGGVGAGNCEANFDLPVDIELTGINAVAQGDREPDGRVAVASSALLENVGTGAIDWGEAIEPVTYTQVAPHPMLSLAFYRLAEGRLEQLGLADVKHAFRAVNSGCSCIAGAIFYPGCGDIYGVTTNFDRKWLGPREEVTARTVSWTRGGSHFDQCLGVEPLPMGDCDPADEPDYTRDHGGNDVKYHDSFEHRLVVPDAALSTPNASYFIEAWYLVAGDTDLWNSIGHRQVEPQLNRETWAFPLIASELRLGSILGRLVEQGATSRVLDTGEGRLELAVTTEDIGSGMTRYEYALMNFDFDRKIERFKIPVEAGVTIQNVSFSGIAGREGAPWRVTLEDDGIAFEAPDGEELDWGMLHRFGFDADRAPVATFARGTPTEEGSAAFIEMATRGPVAVPEPSGTLLMSAALISIAQLRARRR
jgi:hypothetical protein